MMSHLWNIKWPAVIVERLLQPLNINNQNWVLLTKGFLSPYDLVNVFDSNDKKESNSALTIAILNSIALVKTDEKMIPVREARCQQLPEGDGYNCGFFTITVMTELLVNGSLKRRLSAPFSAVFGCA
jgi:hypothetical protein